jgi:GT2 family glycosyltransferase
MGQKNFLEDTPCCSSESRLTPIDLSIVIVNYKSKEKVRACLESIIESDRHDFSYEVILVENASGDDLSDLMALELKIKLIISHKNLCPGSGNNLGISQAEGEYILVLNPDTKIKDHSIITLLNYLRNNNGVGIVGPKQITPCGSIQYSCLRFPNVFLPIFRRTSLGRYFTSAVARFQMKDFGRDSIREVD